MSKTGNGGPAFPESVAVEDGAVTGSRSTAQGMTLRDYFAGQAVVGLLAADTSDTASSFADAAYRIADRMLSRRRES